MGAGLIGTSIGLAAAAAGWRVTVEDADPARAERARERIEVVSHVEWAADSARAGANVLDGVDGLEAVDRVDIVCVAVPPAAVSTALEAASRLYLAATLIDVASVKAQPQQQIEHIASVSSRYIPTHPLGGGEGSGPDAARHDLLRGRSWVLCADPERLTARTTAVVALVQACGAQPVWLSAAEHDRLLAVTSHLPQLLASALAAEVEHAFGLPSDHPPHGPTPSGSAGSVRAEGGSSGGEPCLPADSPGTGLDVLAPHAVNLGSVSEGSNRTSVPVSSLAGPALWDMTRIAASPSEMWAQIARLNHAEVRGALRSLLDRLEAVEAGMVGPGEAADQVAALVDAGRAARARLGRKHRSAFGVEDRGTSMWTWVDVAIDDTPGTLARVFATASRLGVNVEDVRVDHAPYASQGTVSVAVAGDGEARRLQTALRGLTRADDEDLPPLSL